MVALVLIVLVGSAALSGCSARPGSFAVASATLGARGRPATHHPVATGSVDAHQAFHSVASDTGPILETTLTGPRSGVTMRVWVWLPPQYDQPAFAHTRFPALMLYPGGSGVHHNAWVGPSLGARELVAAQSKEGRITPFVLVMPEMQLSVDKDTECADLPGEPAVGTFLSVDVRQMVLANFRVLTDRRGWGAAGVSSGAYCAARLVFDHPDQYAAAVSMDGYFTIETDLPGGRDPRVRAGDPWSVATAQPPDVGILLWSGDGADLVLAQQFVAHVEPPTTAELKVLPGGQHLTEDIAKMVPETFAYFTAHLAHPS